MWCLCLCCNDMMMSACMATGLVGNCWASEPGLLDETGVTAVGFQRLASKERVRVPKAGQRKHVFFVKQHTDIRKCRYIVLD